jgi:diguanylate cyclase (GGDEF)-like protein
MLRNAQRTGAPLSLIFIDVDFFKRYNDHYGHAAGDVLLQRVARQLQQWQPAAQCAARMGGDEFVLLLAGPQDYAQAMQQLAAQLGQVQQLDGHAVQVSVSIGLACFAAGPAPGADEVLRQADMAMYQAKAAGKRSVYVYQPAALP